MTGRSLLRDLLLLLVAGTLVAVLAVAMQPADIRAALLGTTPSPGEGGVACEGAPKTPEWINQGDARALYGREQVIFVDARSEAEHRFGRIPGAVSLPWSDQLIVEPELIQKLQGCKTVVAYCDQEGCADSEALARELLLYGVRQVRVLEGGWPTWYGNGYPGEGEGLQAR